MSLLHAIPCCLLLAHASAQHDPLRLEGAPRELDDALATITSALAGPCPESTFAAADHVLGQLRLGDVAASRKGLACAGRAATTAVVEQLPWVILAHYWHLRATGDHDTARRQREELLGIATKLQAVPVGGTFADESLRVHALFCLGSQLDELARGSENDPKVPPDIGPGAEWTARAVDRQIELERRAWQPGRGHFRVMLTDGELALPETARASLLLPAASGLLIATGDRCLRHLATVLRCPLPATGDECLADELMPALCLSAASQLHDDDLRATWWRALLRSSLLHDHPGFALDAICFALTGIRAATGAAVDPAWLRCSPWLPPGTEALTVRNVLVRGARVDIRMTRADAEHLAVELNLDRPADEPLPVVVQRGATQTIGELQPGRPFTCSLAGSQPHPQHDAHGLGRR